MGHAPSPYALGEQGWARVGAGHHPSPHFPKLGKHSANDCLGCRLSLCSFSFTCTAAAAEVECVGGRQQAHTHPAPSTHLLDGCALLLRRSPVPAGGRRRTSVELHMKDWRQMLQMMVMALLFTSSCDLPPAARPQGRVRGRGSRVVAAPAAAPRCSPAIFFSFSSFLARAMAVFCALPAQARTRPRCVSSSGSGSSGRVPAAAGAVGRRPLTPAHGCW